MVNGRVDSAQAARGLGLIVLAGLGLVSLYMGPTDIAVQQVVSAFTGTADPGLAAIVLDIRLPRLIMAVVSGASLALCGLVFQTAFRNPLADPYILGISGGAAVSVALSVLIGSVAFLRPLWAFGGGMASLALTGFLAVNGMGFRDANRLLLCGVMVNAFCGAALMVLMALAGPEHAGYIMLWAMGDLGASTLRQAVYCAVALGAGCWLLSRCGHIMNLLLLDDDEAATLGVPVRAMRCGLLLTASVLVSLTVAVVGPLGFVGLVIPQTLRRFVPDNRRLAPACALLGAVFLLTCDLFARSLPTTSELPTGVVTALIGAPVFMWLLRRES